MKKLNFTVIGKPQPKQRAFVKRNGISFTPKETMVYENLVKMTAFEAMRVQNVSIFDGPVSVRIKAYFNMPKYLTASEKKKKLNMELIENNKLFPTKKPDADNICKAICDGLNGVAYKDDSLICRLFIEKVYGDIQKTEIEITEF